MSNILICIAYASSITLICVLEWNIVSKILQIWDKAQPVDPRRDGDYAEKHN